MFKEKVLVIILISFGYVLSECPLPDPIKECFSQAEFDAAIDNARSQFEMMEKMLSDNYNVTGITVTPNDPAFTHFYTQNIDESSFEANRASIIRATALKSIKLNKGYTTSQLKVCLKATSIDTSNICPTQESVNCSSEDSSYYRFDGKCNNLKNPLWGAGGTATLRLFENGYSDGIDFDASQTPKRTARSDAMFANDRKGKNTQNFPETNSDFSSMIAQMLTHEMVKTKKAQLKQEKTEGGFNCCNPQSDDFIGNLISLNKFCAPIAVDSTDKCFGKQQVKCLNYVKSMTSMQPGCPLDETQTPTNFHNPYLDGQLLYNQYSQEHLDANGGIFNLNDFESIKSIIVEYDDRSQQLPALFQFVHNFYIVHNRFFGVLQKSRPDLSTSRISFETRRIITAIYQKIYLDFISSVLPRNEASMINKLINTNDCYDEDINPQVPVELLICLRSFHYFLRESQSFYQESAFTHPNGVRGQTPVEHPLNSLVDNLTVFQENTCGMKHGTLDVAWNLGGVGEQITCKFFAANSSSVGTDLRSMDYQQARIVGEPPYIEVLKDLYGISKCPSEYTKTDFIKHSKSGQTALFNRVGNIAADIPFSLAVDMEDRRGEVLTPTCGTIIAQQLRKSVCADRFFFSNAEFFTDDKKDAIREITYRDILCLTNMRCQGTRFQDDVFLSPGAENIKRPCDSSSVVYGILGLDSWIDD